MYKIDKDTIAIELLNLTVLIIGCYNFIYFNLGNLFNILWFVCYQMCLFMFLNEQNYFKFFLKYSVYILYGIFLINIISIILKYNQFISIRYLSYTFINGTCIYFVKYLVDYILNRRYRLVKYNGIMYEVSVLEKLKILHIQIHLLFLRILRNSHRIFLYLTTTFIVLFLWFIFIIIVSYFKNNNFGIENILKLVDKNSSSIFTSCILVAFTTIYKENGKYRENLNKQYILYRAFLYESDRLIKNLLFLDTDEDLVLMTVSTKEYYYNKIKNMGEQFYSFDDEIVLNIINILNRIKDMINQEQIYYWKKEYEFMLDEIDGIFKIVSKRESSTDDVLTLLNCMSWLIYYLRIPWRRDYEDNQEIRRIIAQRNVVYAYPDNVFLKDTDSSIGQ